MPKVRCFYDDCIFLAKGYCDAPSVEIDPEDGCLTYSDDPEDLDGDLEIFDEDEADIDEFDEDWEDEGYEEINFDDEEDFE